MFVADLHIHSSYSRATSRDCSPVMLDKMARLKGVHVVSTGDFTHPAYRVQLTEELVESGDGLYSLKSELSQELPGCLHDSKATSFVISGEISCIYKYDGKVRKVHNVILLPSLESAGVLAGRLEKIGNVHSDGRPILGIDSRDLLEITLDVCPNAIFIPAHIWTPHFSVLGAYSGFNSLKECFRDLEPYVYAVETGLSSDPAMNYRCSFLDKYALVSNSDAHSPSRLAREANVFQCEQSYSGILAALNGQNPNGLWGTLEFFPEEGKYHYDGCRKCHLCLTPSQAKELNWICPTCGGRLTRGVLARVEELADRPEGFVPKQARPYESLVPLAEVIANAMGLSSSTSVRVQRQYNLLIETLGAELDILRNVSLSDIDAVAGACVAEAVRRLRNGKVDLQPGYDGEYGRVALLSAEDRDAINGQVALFSGFGQADTSKKRSKRSAAAKADSSASKDRIDKKESTDIFAELSEEQLKAVCSSNSTTVVTAGPGSGKTKTLVSRICWLLEKQSIKPENITAVTFTNKAAAELKDRISRQYQSDGKNIINKMHIGTFHSICLEMLREKGRVLPVLDPVEAASLAADLAFNIEGLGKDAYGVINRYKNGITKNLNENEQALLVSYEQELSNWGVMDLDDILLHVLKADDWDMSKFSHLLVDEFQDINEIQHQLIKKWSADSDSLFVIGDADQSIYGFRGANANCFDRLAAEKSQLNMVSLNCNYRSTPQIVEFAHPLSSTYSNTEVKTVRSEGDAVHSYRCVSQYDEASFISQEIINLVGGIDMISAAMQRQGNKNIGFADIAVLARTHKQLDIIADVLKENGIACRIAGRDSVLTSSYIRDALAWFRWMYNPADMISLRRLLRSADIPDAECALLLEKFRKTGSKSIAALLKLCKKQKAEDAKEVVATAAYLANRLYRDNAEKLLQSYIDARFLGGVEELEQLMSMAVTYSDMRSLLQAVTMGEEIDVQRSNGKKYNADAVLLSTLHGSKGLEFPIVFLAGVKEGTMPLKRDNDAVDLAEEQRLFYVGMTRAMDKLYLLLSDPQSVFISKLSMHNVVDINNTYRHRTKKQQLSLF